MSTVKVLTTNVVIEFFFKISIALAIIMVTLCPVLSTQPVAILFCRSALLATIVFIGSYAFSEIKTLTQKIE